jgi:hypothetical protein
MAEKQLDYAIGMTKRGAVPMIKLIITTVGNGEQVTTTLNFTATDSFTADLRKALHYLDSKGEKN